MSNRRNRGGRPHHDFWLKGNFEQITLKSKPAALCQICLRSLRNTSKFRLIQHRRRCRGTSNILIYDSDAENSYTIEYLQPEKESSESSLNECNGKETKEKHKIKDNKTTKSLINSLTESKKEKRKQQIEKDEIDKALATFFIGCNIPPSVVESNIFKNLVKTLRPSYEPPSQETLTAMFLNKTIDLFKVEPSSKSDMVEFIKIENKVRYCS